MVTESACKKGRALYTAQAALEYLISILVAGSFLATLTKQLGFSDSLTGILSSFISLGCLFQLFSVFLHKRQMKPVVIVMSVINQVLFSLLYIIPILNLRKPIKTALFIAAVFLAYILYYIVHPKKINWLMSLVEDGKRGRFTASKEIISLIAGMIFQFAMGALIDTFASKGQLKTAFMLAGAIMLVMTVLHTLCMLGTPEKPIPYKPTAKLTNTIKELITNKKVLHITVVFVLYYAGTYFSVPFYGTYNINELGFSLTFVSALTIFGSVTRILVSRFWGKYADKHSFAIMTEKCLLVLGASYLCFTFATPATAKVAVALYYLIHGIAMGGINSALTNLIFDYIAPEKRADSLALCQAMAGTVGFIATLIASPLVSFVQNQGNTFLGLPVYAQQVTSFISLLLTITAILYVRQTIKKD